MWILPICHSVVASVGWSGLPHLSVTWCAWKIQWINLPDQSWLRAKLKFQPKRILTVCTAVNLLGAAITLYPSRKSNIHITSARYFPLFAFRESVPRWLFFFWAFSCCRGFPGACQFFWVHAEHHQLSLLGLTVPLSVNCLAALRHAQHSLNLLIAGEDQKWWGGGEAILWRNRATYLLLPIVSLRNTSWRTPGFSKRPLKKHRLLHK